MFCGKIFVTYTQNNKNRLDYQRRKIDFKNLVYLNYDNNHYNPNLDGSSINEK